MWHLVAIIIIIIITNLKCFDAAVSVLPKLWPGNSWLPAFFVIVFCAFHAIPKVNSEAIQPSFIIPTSIYEWEAAWNMP